MFAPVEELDEHEDVLVDELLEEDEEEIDELEDEDVELLLDVDVDEEEDELDEEDELALLIVDELEDGLEDELEEFVDCVELATSGGPELEALKVVEVLEVSVDEELLPEAWPPRATR